jgi:hypothetical protein
MEDFEQPDIAPAERRLGARAARELESVEQRDGVRALRLAAEPDSQLLVERFEQGTSRPSLAVPERVAKGVELRW